MKEQFNSHTVYQTLKTIQPLLKKNAARYWFMGSIIPTALNGQLYREVHDFDIIVVPKNLQELLASLYTLGCTKKSLHALRVSERMGVYVFTHPSLLDIGFFVIDEYADCYLIDAGSIRVEIPKKHLASRRYRFKDIIFPGILPSYSYRLALLAKHNPKRSQEMMIYQSHNIKPAQWPFYQFMIAGRNANWVMDLLNTILMVIGRTRTAIGLPYDPWQ